MAIGGWRFCSQGKAGDGMGIGLGHLYASYDANVEVFEDFRTSCLVAELAFPNTNDIPASIDEVGLVSTIPESVSIDLAFPEISVCFGCLGMLATLVTMPKTTVNEDYGSVFGQHDVGCAGKFTVADTKAQPLCKKELPNQHLGLGVLAFDGCHSEASFLRCHRVGHILLSNISRSKIRTIFEV